MSAIQDIAEDYKVKAALAAFNWQTDDIVQLAIEVQQIPSPTGAEAEVAAFIEQRLGETGLSDIHQDSLYNTFARLPGEESHLPLVLSAHTDTVFPLGTDLSVRFGPNSHADSQLISGPGLADNALGVAGLIWLAQIISATGFVTKRDIWFVANVGEEGLGNLCGMRRVVDRFGDQATYIVVEGGSYGHVFHQAIGVQRFELQVASGGGHSWGDYGELNAIHEISKIITELYGISLPVEPKTTLNAGVISGGTTINSIAAKAKCQLDLRSISPEVLRKVVDEVSKIVQGANQNRELDVSLKEIGNRPAGIIPRDTDLIKMAAEALELVGCNKVKYMAGSTDANIPISRGIPAVCIGLANSANTHRLDEYVDKTHLAKGMGQLLLLTLGVAGVEL